MRSALLGGLLLALVFGLWLAASDHLSAVSTDDAAEGAE